MTLRTHCTCAVSAIALACGLHGAPAVAGSEPCLGEIFCGGWNFSPRGTISLEGQLLPISQYTALLMNNMPPFVTIRCVMAIQGVFPSRNRVIPDSRARVWPVTCARRESSP